MQHNETLGQMIDSVRSASLTADERVLNAMREIDRAMFVKPDQLEYAYDDMALPIGHRATISQPSTVAFMLSLLDPRPGNHVLDIGSGSGWTTALLAHLVGDEGRVVGLEIVPELVEFGAENIHKYPGLRAVTRVARKGVLGIPGESFDRILMSASAKIFPAEIIDQLAVNGRFVGPIGSDIVAITKMADGALSRESYGGFAFVPLQD